MIHFLTLGHLDVEAVRRGAISVRRPLDPVAVCRVVAKYAESYGVSAYSLRGHALTTEGGTVTCPWLMPVRIREAEELAVELARETGCLIADLGCRKILDPSQLLHDPAPEQLDALTRVLKPKLNLGGR